MERRGQGDLKGEEGGENDLQAEKSRQGDLQMRARRLKRVTPGRPREHLSFPTRDTMAQKMVGIFCAFPYIAPYLAASGTYRYQL